MARPTSKGFRWFLGVGWAVLLLGLVSAGCGQDSTPGVSDDYGQVDDTVVEAPDLPGSDTADTQTDQPPDPPTEDTADTQTDQPPDPPTEDTADTQTEEPTDSGGIVASTGVACLGDLAAV